MKVAELIIKATDEILKGVKEAKAKLAETSVKIGNIPDIEFEVGILDNGVIADYSNHEAIVCKARFFVPFGLSEPSAGVDGHKSKKTEPTELKFPASEALARKRGRE